MSYGLITKNDNGNFLLTSENKAFVYNGKATKVGAVFNSDIVSFGRNWYARDPNPGPLSWYTTSVSPYDPPHVFTPSPSTGVADIRLWWYAVLGGTYYSFGFYFSNDQAIITYEVWAPTKPIIFVQGPSGTGGNVLSCHNIGTMRGNDYKWSIKVIVSYPSGQRSQVDNLVLYTFVRMPDITLSSYGIVMRNSLNELCFATPKLPLVISDILSLNSISGSTMSTINVANTLSTGNALTISKPAFLAVDWFRATLTSSGASLVPISYWHSGDYQYKSYGNWTAMIQQRLISAGFNIKGGAVNIKLGAVGEVLYNYPTQSPNLQSISSIQTINLPFEIPIIDGSLYD